MNLFIRPLLRPAFAVAACAASVSSLAAGACTAQSAATITPVIELYTSEGCSSCPPADKWFSSLKAAAAEGRVVPEAFHVGYWDYIGWVDRFAVPSHTTRQRRIASMNHLPGIYTPQLVRNGRDLRSYDSVLSAPSEPARATIRIDRTGSDAFEASVAPVKGTSSWAAYWTVTENGHSSKVKAGENAGEFLRHDFVVRQYVDAGRYEGAQHLRFNTVPADPTHPRRVNLVVFDPADGRTLQTLGVSCG
jgi:hypothetical protein